MAADRVELSNESVAALAAAIVAEMADQAQEVDQGSAGPEAWPVAPNITRGNGAVDANTQRVVLASDQFQGTLTDRSIASASGSSQQACAANSVRRYLLFQNPTTATGSFWVRLDGSAATMASPSIEIAPGVTLTFEDTFVPTGQVNVIGTAGMAITVKEGA